MVATQGTLGLLHLTTKLLNGTFVLGHIFTVLLLEDIHEVLHHALVEVLTAQVGVTIGSHHLEDAVVDGQQRHIEGATTEVVDKDVLLGLLIQAVGNGRGRRLVDDAQDVHSRDGARILRGLALAVVEIGRHRDHRVVDLGSQVGFSCLFHLQQDHGRHFFRVKLLLLTLSRHDDHGFVALTCDHLEGPELDVGLHNGVGELAADQTLGIEDGILGVARHLVLGCVADEALRIRKGHVARRGAVALVVGNDFHPTIFVDANAGVGGAQVDSNHWALDLLCSSSCSSSSSSSIGSGICWKSSHGGCLASKGSRNCKVQRWRLSRSIAAVPASPGFDSQR
mmetsp:Transcript_66483/g.105199  ORF Transcript_66483/g.105199 Transcript_66483/m.105199 type:complete len:338 (-) Transcript_66483:1340-2353(-)